jgi:glycerol-3-phosphate acyltransferase PlsY
MMMPLLVSAALLLCAYLLGSIPTGYLLTYALEGIDIRNYGSGSIGATNVLRTVGKRAAVAVLLIDLLKGYLAVSLIKIAYLTPAAEILPDTWYPWLITVAGLLGVLGHSCSIWLGFKGGKSVAISIGILLVMNPWVALGAITSFLLTLGISRIVSLSSIAGAIGVNIFMLLLHQPLPYQSFAAFAGIYVIWRHRGNIGRIFTGKEPKIGQKLPQESV